MTDAKAWPPKSGLTTPNVSREAAVFTSAASIRINAPAASVFDAVIAVDEYPKWNNFVPKVTIHRQPDGQDDKKLHVGTLFTFHVIMDGKKPHSATDTQLIVTDISTPERQSDYVSKDLLQDDSFTSDLSGVYRISWKCEGGFASRGLKTERFHEILVLGENECEVRTWEPQGGMLAYTVRWMFKKTLDQKFQLWVDDLKKYCEERSGKNDVA